MSNDVDIRVSGMGRCFDAVLEHLEKTLKAAGAKVTLVNYEEPVAYRPPTLEGYEIVIRAVHQPWGG